MEPLEIQVGTLLFEKSLTLTTAESCTGGLISARLTDVPGSSHYLLGGVVAYADDVKQQLLGVLPDMLAQHGAVSEPVARQMARGARMLLAADCGLSVTGIAGPGGWTEEKAVGLTFIGLSTPEGTWVRRFEWNGDRMHNRNESVRAALEFLLAYLRGELS